MILQLIYFFQQRSEDIDESTFLERVMATLFFGIIGIVIWKVGDSIKNSTIQGTIKVVACLFLAPAFYSGLEIAFSVIIVCATLYAIYEYLIVPNLKS